MLHMGLVEGLHGILPQKDEYHEVLAKASLLEEDIPEFQLLESLLIK